jgi:hypothetical protein
MSARMIHSLAWASVPLTVLSLGPGVAIHSLS